LFLCPPFHMCDEKVGIKNKMGLKNGETGVERKGDTSGSRVGVPVTKKKKECGIEFAGREKKEDEENQTPQQNKPVPIKNPTEKTIHCLKVHRGRTKTG